MSNGLPDVTHCPPDGLDDPDPNIARLIDLGVLRAGYTQLGAHQPLARELRHLADWVEDNFARKPDPMQQAIERATLRS